MSVNRAQHRPAALPAAAPAVAGEVVADPDRGGGLAGPIVAAAPSAGRRQLGRLDTVLFLISAMVVVDTIGAISVGGAQAFTWLVVLGLTFFVPSALATAELGAALPEEGGAYVWVREAFGARAGSLASLLYWAGTPVWVGGSVAVVAISVVDRFVVAVPTSGRLLLGLVFVGLASLGGVVPLRVGKWVPGSGAIAQVALLGFFTVSVIAYGVRHGVHGLAAGDLRPSSHVFVAVVPVLLYSFVGVELPSAAAEEMHDPCRDVPVAILRGGIAQALMYGVPVLAVLCVLPPERISSLGGFLDALRDVLTVYGGRVSPDGSASLTGVGAFAGLVTAATFVWVLLASGTTWLMGTARTQAAACRDGAGPAALGRISPVTGVPVTMTALSGVASAVVLIVGFAATGGDGQRYFTVTLTGAIAFDVLAFLLVYPSFAVLRHRRPHLARPFRVPGGSATAWLLTLASTGWTVVAAVCLLWPGLGTAQPDAHLPAGFEGRRWDFELLAAAPVTVLLTAVVLYGGWCDLARRRTGRAAAAALSAAATDPCRLDHRNSRRDLDPSVAK